MGAHRLIFALDNQITGIDHNKWMKITNLVTNKCEMAITAVAVTIIPKTTATITYVSLSIQKISLVFTATIAGAASIAPFASDVVAVVVAAVTTTATTTNAKTVFQSVNNWTIFHICFEITKRYKFLFFLHANRVARRYSKNQLISFWIQRRDRYTCSSFESELMDFNEHEK